MRKRLAAMAARGWNAVGVVKRAALLGLALSAGAAVFGAPADIARGLAWLQAQVQIQGQLAVESRVAAQQQARCETANTLIKLSAGSAQVSALVASLQEPAVDATTETIACWQRLRELLGQNVLAADLESRRLGQQGYAPHEGSGVASVLDTGWALSARLQSMGDPDRASVIAWLLSRQRVDGAFREPGGAGILDTAVVLRSLHREAARNTAAGQIATKAAAWLLAQGGDQGHWLDDVATTALVYEAVHPYSGQVPTLASQVEAYLLGKQQADGSWAGDPYVTALALRALALTPVAPADPTFASAATLRGVASAADTGQPLAGVAIQAATAGGTTKTATTDAQGRYLLQGIAPGNVSLSATHAGYLPISTAVHLGSATTAVFSPTLYPVGAVLPAGARIVGRVIGFGTDLPLAGVAVSASTASGAPVVANTGADGRFELTVSAGTYTVTYALAAYINQSQRVIITNGATADVGTVAVRRLRETSTMRGVVSDLQGQPVAGATVALQSGQVAVSNSGGGYSLDNLSGLEFIATVSAPDYMTRSYTVKASEPTDVVQNFTLPSLSAAYLSLSDMALSADTVGLRRDVTVSVIIGNPSAVEASGLATLEVINPLGERIATLAALGEGGVTLSTVTLAAGQQRSVSFKWNSASFSPGIYRLNARLHIPGTLTTENPSGVIFAAVSRNLNISGGTAFIGSITANPPVLRAGTNVPVKLSALIQNDGNTALPAQGYRLAVVDTKTGQATHTQTVSSEELLVSQLRELSFADWTPVGGGNFRLELTAASTPGALVTSTLYVGDSGTATFTIDKPVVPAGTSTVRGSVKVSGQSVANGTINDPLVPLVKQALVKAVNYADNYAANHFVADLKCYACHVQTQGLVGGERNLKFAPPLDPIKRTTLLNGITQYVRQSGGVQHYDGTVHIYTNTTLGLWAATTWHDPAAVAMSNRLMADFLISSQRSDGSWDADHAASWWRTKAPLAALNLGSLDAVKKSLVVATPKAPRLTSAAIPGLPAGDMKLATDASGNLYAAHYARREVWKVSPAGVPTLLVSNIAANSARPLPDGRILIGAGDGVYIRAIDGAVRKISSISAWDVKPHMDGRYLLSAWNQNTVYLVSEQGVATPLFTNSLLQANLAGVEPQPDGSYVAGSRIGTRLVRFNASGALLDVPAPITNGQVLNVTRHGEGNVANTEAGLFYYNKEWAVERWGYDRVYSFVAMPDGRLLVNRAGGLYRLHLDTVDTQAFSARVDSSVAKSAAWLKAGVGIDANNNIDLAFRLIGLGKAKEHYKGTARANEFDPLMQSLAATLRSRQRADGGWVWLQNTHGVSDSMVTAMVGLALDYLNPSKDSPEVRKAIQLLLGRQQADGTWITENSVVPQSIKLIPSTWVEIWLPTMQERLGGIDTDLSVTFPANVTMSNPDRTPTSTVTAGDGSSTRLWKLTGVTEASQQVNFDLALKDMQVDEVRAVAQQASLVFRNSFVAGSVTATISIPRVAATTNLVHSVATNKPSYTEADQAIFTAPVFNGGTAPRSGQVRFTVLDAAAQLVQTLPLPATVSVPGGGNVASVGTWPVAGVLAGNYQVRAELLSPTGLLYGTATASFTVTASQQQLDATRIATDRASYTAAQSVQVNSRAANLTGNVVQEDLRAVTVVRSASGQPVFSQTEAIAQLAPGGQRQYSYGIAASGLAVGSYSASLQLLNAQGTVLSQSSTAFSVLGTDQTGVGLTGQLQAMPSVVLIGQPVALNLSAANSGNTALASVPVIVRIIEPQTGTVVASFNQTVNSWLQGTSQTMAWSWTAQGLDGQTLVAVASANISGRDISLGQANIRLVGVPQLKAEPAQLDFPLVYAGEAADGQTSTVASIGTATATSVTLSLAGAHPSQFVIPEGGCAQTASLPMGATCTLTVSYRPSDAGQHSAELRITYDRGADVVIQLTGQAKPIILSGSVAPAPAEIHVGDTTSLAYSLSNPAGVGVTASVSLSVLTEQGQPVASWPFEAAVGANATTAGNRSYTAETDPQVLSVVLSQNVAGSNTVLATNTLVVTEIPVKVDPVAAIRREARILVLVSCPPESSRGSADEALCVQQRMQGIANYLDSLGITNRVVSTQAEFKQEMCCGTYNTYWISGGAAKLSAELVGQLRESIWAGESLITDGVHDSRNHLLHGVVGIEHRGKLPASNQNIDIPEGSLYAPGTLPTLGQPLKAQLLPGAKAQAWFSQMPGNQAPLPAIVSNGYGQGNSLLFAFDLAGMVTADPQASNAQLRDAMIVTAIQSANGTQTLTIGDLTALAMSVSNQGTRTTAVEVRASLPAGLAHHSANIEPAQVQQQGGTTSVTWKIALASLQRRELTWRVLARQPGVFEIPVNFYSVPQRAGEVPRLLDTRSFSLAVQQPSQLVQEALAQVQALQPTAASDKSDKSKAVNAANQAVGLHAQGRYQEAITQWLAAADALINIASAPTTAARDAVAKALEASTDALCSAAP